MKFLNIAGKKICPLCVSKFFLSWGKVAGALQIKKSHSLHSFPSGKTGNILDPLIQSGGITKTSKQTKSSGGQGSDVNSILHKVMCLIFSNSSGLNAEVNISVLTRSREILSNLLHCFLVNVPWQQEYLISFPLIFICLQEMKCQKGILLSFLTCLIQFASTYIWVKLSRRLKTSLHRDGELAAGLHLFRPICQGSSYNWIPFMQRKKKCGKLNVWEKGSSLSLLSDVLVLYMYDFFSWRSILSYSPSPYNLKWCSSSTDGTYRELPCSVRVLWPVLAYMV